MQTIDGVEVCAAEVVFAITPWADVIELYVDVSHEEASTSTAPELGAASSCRYPVSQCYSSEELARSVACTYVEDDEGFYGPPSK